MTQCVRSIIMFRNDERPCTHFGPVRLEIITSLIIPMTFTRALVTRMFLWWPHKVILICVIRLTNPHKLCDVKKLVHHEVYLLEILVTHYFMIGWWMVLRKIIRPVVYSPFPIGIQVANFCTIFKPMVFHISVFGTFRLHKRVDNSNACFAVRIKGVSIFWLWVVHGNEGISDRDHCLYVEEHPSCFRLCCWGHYMF